MIGPTVSIGARPHWATVVQPQGLPVPDGDGSFTQAWVTAVPPIWQIAITSPSQAAVERIAPGTTITTGTYVISGPYRSDITTASRVLFGPRIFQVEAFRDREERHLELECLCRELPPP